MTRLEAIKHIRAGRQLNKVFGPDMYGVVRTLEVMIQYTKYCDYPRRRMWQHEEIGPIHVRLDSIWPPHWIHITPKQLLGFIRRNFKR